MLRRLLGILLQLGRRTNVQLTDSATEAPAVDTRNLIYSLATLCDPGPATDSVAPDGDYVSLHEDHWRQIEFVAGINAAHIKRELATLRAFKEQHSKGPGWTDIYLRAEHPIPLEEVALHVADLPSLETLSLRIPGESLFSGQVRGGFALSDGTWSLYGQRTADGLIVQLALGPGQATLSGDLAGWISRLAGSFNLLLVDWYVGCLVDTSSAETVLQWALERKPEGLGSL